MDGNTLARLSVVQKFLNDYVKITEAQKKILINRPDSIYKFPYQTQDSFSFQISFIRARCLLGQATGSSKLTSENKLAKIKESLSYLFLSLSQLPKNEAVLENPALKKMAVNIIKTIDTAYREIFRLNNRPEYLQLSLLLPAFLLRNAYGNQNQLYTDGIKPGAVSQKEIEKLLLTDGRGNKSEAASRLAALVKIQETISGKTYESWWKLAGEKASAILPSTLDEKIARVNGSAFHQLVPGELNCLLEMDSDKRPGCCAYEQRKQPSLIYRTCCRCPWDHA